MPAGKSAGASGMLATVALIAGIALVLVAGAFASDAFLHPASVTSASSSTQPVGPAQTGTSYSGGETTAVSSKSQTGTPAQSSSSTSTLASTTSTFTTTAPSTSSLTSSSTTSAAISSSSTKSSATGTSSTVTTATTSTSTQPGTIQILLPQDVGNNESLNFQPSKIKVVIGVNNTIVWNDQDYVQHTVKSVSVPNGAKAWDSGILNEGQTFTLVLSVPGSYRYVCSIHPDWMIGTIQVVP